MHDHYTRSKSKLPAVETQDDRVDSSSSMAANEESAPPTRLTDLPNEMLLNIAEKVINRGPDSIFYYDSMLDYYATNIAAGVNDYTSEKLAKMEPFMACKKLYAVAKDVLCSRTAPRALEVGHIISPDGEYLYRLRGNLVNHSYCLESIVEIRLSFYYIEFGKEDLSIENRGSLRATLEGILVKCVSLKKVVFDFSTANYWYEDFVEKWLHSMSKKLQAIQGREAVVIEKVEWPNSLAGTGL